MLNFKMENEATHGVNFFSSKSPCLPSTYTPCLTNTHTHTHAAVSHYNFYLYAGVVLLLLL